MAEESYFSLKAIAMAEETQNIDSIFSWNLPRTKYLDIKLYSQQGLSLFAKIAIALGVGIGVGGTFLIAAPFALAGIGFSASGVVAGSLAATWQATIGNVVAGSMFATFQSVGAAGLGFFGIGVASAFGAATGVAAGVIFTRNGRKSIPIITLEKTFKLYMKNKIEIVSYEDLENILAHLDLSFGQDVIQNTYKRATGRSAKGPIIYEEFLRFFGVKLLKGQELEKKLTYEFIKKTTSSNNSSMTLQELSEVLDSLEVTGASTRDVEVSFANVSERLGTDVKRITLDIFLEMCGCRFNNNFDLEMQVNFFEQNNTDGKIDIKKVFNFDTLNAKTIKTVLGSVFLVSLEEYLAFFDLKLNFEPLSAALTFKLSLLYFEFVRLADTSDMTISVSEAKNILALRGYVEANYVHIEGERSTQKRLNLHEFLGLFGTFIDYHKVLNTEDYIINPNCYIYTSQVHEYLNRQVGTTLLINTNILKEIVHEAIKQTTGDETARFLNYFEFIEVLLVFDSFIRDVPVM